MTSRSPTPSREQIPQLVVRMALLSPIGVFGPPVTYGVLRHGAAQWGPEYEMDWISPPDWKFNPVQMDLDWTGL